DRRAARRGRREAPGLAAPTISDWRNAVRHGTTCIAPIPPTLGAVHVETQFIDLPDPIALDIGRELRDVRIAYETYGELTAARNNVVLVCHALSGDAHAAGITPGAPSAGELDTKALGWWDPMIGGRRAFDTD